MHQVEHAGWLNFFPRLKQLNSPAWNRMLTHSNHIQLKQGGMIFKAGEACQNYLFILSGTVRVKKSGNSGHELTLYRLYTGQVCEITTTCLLANQTYQVEAVAETEVRAVLVPKQYFHEALRETPEFREYVYSSLDKRLNVLLDFIEEVAYEPIDIRLARCLLENKNASNEVRVTHYQLATMLGTAREVVSRSLKSMENSGAIKRSRGCVKILNPDVLHAMH
ncbi:MAG: Crp/Fnr family transcriptional regulator [Gammaproteobacteria bacterium]|nr:Crp/Fnr family transcriptional regulator [Gammaproteobacteria bacterium]